jgi:hypothetical protein
MKVRKLSLMVGLVVLSVVLPAVPVQAGRSIRCESGSAGAALETAQGGSGWHIMRGGNP